jgi:hypothetical protein
MCDDEDALLLHHLTLNTGLPCHPIRVDVPVVDQLLPVIDAQGGPMSGIDG